MPKKTAPTLPFDIVALILKMVDFTELHRTCTLINRTWASAARRKLWRMCTIDVNRKLSEFLDLIQFPFPERGGLVNVTSLITELTLELNPANIRPICNILAHMGQSHSLKTLSLLDVCPGSVEKIEMALDWDNSKPGSSTKNNGGLDIEKLQQFFRRFVHIRWTASLGSEVTLASAHEGLRVVAFGSLAIGSLPRENIPPFIRCCSPNLIAVDVSNIFVKLGGKELVLLGKTCPNLKAFQWHNLEMASDEEWEKFFSARSISLGLEYLGINVYSPRHLQVIARYCRTLKHLRVVFPADYGLYFDGLESDVFSHPPTSRDYEDLLRNVGSTILTFSVTIVNHPVPIAQHLVPAIIHSCPLIERVRISDFSKTPLEEDDVRQLFKECKTLTVLMQRGLVQRLWTRVSGASFDSATFDFDDFVRTM